MITTATDFYTLINSKFPFEPTYKQGIVLKKLASFIFESGSNDIFLLKGYAGTGKTSIVGCIVNNLWQAKKSAVLLAPTGRAAKVISNYSKKEAFTIHRKIYFPKKQKEGGVKFVLQPNKHRNTLFIVDEASMIPDDISDHYNSLLNDLIHYVYSGFQCRLILIGDIAQLPPVKSNLSPALDENILSLNYNKKLRNNSIWRKKLYAKRSSTSKIF